MNRKSAETGADKKELGIPFNIIKKEEKLNGKDF